jgi:hypothetical protein
VPQPTSTTRASAGMAIDSRANALRSARARSAQAVARRVARERLVLVEITNGVVRASTGSRRFGMPSGASN